MDGDELGLLKKTLNDASTVDEKRVKEMMGLIFLAT